MGAADEAVDGFKGFGGCGGVGWEEVGEGAIEEGLLAAGVEHFREGAVGEEDAAVGVEGGDAVGDGFEHGFELGAAGFQFQSGRFIDLRKGLGGGFDLGDGSLQDPGPCG